MLTPTETEPLPVPEPGEMLSQFWSSEAVQLSVPLAVLLMFTVWAAGLEPPAVPLKFRVSGETASAGCCTGTGAVEVTESETLVTLDVVPSQAVAAPL